MEPPRSTAQRVADTRARLAREVDCWVSSASAGGEAYLIPLSYIWRDGRLVLATLAGSLTARNLRRAGRARVALDGTRDVILIEGALEIVARAAIDPDLGDAFTAVGFDPRVSANDYVYLVLTPRAIRAWREENELAGREIMREGVWLA